MSWSKVAFAISWARLSSVCVIWWRYLEVACIIAYARQGAGSSGQKDFHDPEVIEHGANDEHALLIFRGEELRLYCVNRPAAPSQRACRVRVRVIHASSVVPYPTPAHRRGHDGLATSQKFSAFCSHRERYTASFFSGTVWMYRKKKYATRG